MSHIRMIQSSVKLDNNLILDITKEANALIEHERQESKLPGEASFSEAEIERALKNNQDGDASLFKRIHHGRLAFDHAARRWYVWRGYYWSEDLVEEALAAIDYVVEVYEREAQRWAWIRLKASKENDKDSGKEAEAKQRRFLSRIAALQVLKRKRDILVLAAAGEHSLGMAGEEWDSDPWLLGCVNGTIDLRNGVFRSGKQSDYIKTVCPTPWQGLEAKAPIFESFLKDTFDSNTELISYVQRFFGYAITGQVSEHIMAIFCGHGRNGKGTLLEIIGHVLGPLAGPIKAEMLLKQAQPRSSGSPDSDIIKLRGKRMVWASETDEGRLLNHGKVKWLTGGDTLCGREPYARREVQFTPTHKLVMVTNYKPKVDPNDFAMWQRIHLVPFTQSFVDEPHHSNEQRRNPHLLEQLRSEAPGILAWLVRGCMAWQREGLRPPATVKAATKRYREEEDILGQYLEERCFRSPQASVQAGKLYADYRAWCQEMGHTPDNNTIFGKYMRGCFETTEGRVVFYRGVGLKAFEREQG